MNTLLLDRVNWDLVLDQAGNIAVVGDPYSQAQDAASQVRLFQGELWYDLDQGIPYWTEILGKLPNVALMKSRFVEAALLVPGTVDARCFFVTLDDRTPRGQVQITNNAGGFAVSNF